MIAPRAKASSIDAGLDRAIAEAQPGQPMSCSAIARFAGCSQAYLQQVEARALRKLRKLIGPELRAELTEELHALSRSREVATPWMPPPLRESDLWRP